MGCAEFGSTLAAIHSRMQMWLDGRGRGEVTERRAESGAAAQLGPRGKRDGSDRVEETATTAVKERGFGCAVSWARGAWDGELVLQLQCAQQH